MSDAISTILSESSDEAVTIPVNEVLHLNTNRVLQELSIYNAGYENLSAEKWDLLLNNQHARQFVLEALTLTPDVNPADLMAMFGKEYVDIFASDILGVADEIAGYQMPGSEADPKDPLVDNVSKYFGYQRIEMGGGAFAEDLIFKFVDDQGKLIDSAISEDYEDLSNEEKMARMIHKCALAGQLDGYGFELSFGKLKSQETLSEKIINRALVLSLLATSIMPLPLDNTRISSITNSEPSSFGSNGESGEINDIPTSVVPRRDVVSGAELNPVDSVTLPTHPSGNDLNLGMGFIDGNTASQLDRTVSFSVRQDGGRPFDASITCESGDPAVGGFRSSNKVESAQVFTLAAGDRFCDHGDTILKIFGYTSGQPFSVDVDFAPGSENKSFSYGASVKDGSNSKELRLGNRREVLILSGEGKDEVKTGLQFQFDEVVPFSGNAELITGTVSVELPGASGPITSSLKYNPETNTLSTPDEFLEFDKTTDSLQSAVVNFFLEGFPPVQGNVSVMTPRVSQEDPRFDLVFLGPSAFSTSGDPDLQKALINSLKLWNEAENQTQKPLIMVGQYGNSEGIDSVNLSKNEEAQEIDSIVSALEGLGIDEISILFLSHGEDEVGKTGILLSIGGGPKFYSRDDLANLVNRHPRMRFTVYSMVCKGSGLIPTDIPENLRMFSQTSGPTGLNTPLRPNYELPGGISGFYGYHTQRLSSGEALSSMQDDTNNYTAMGIGVLRYENSPRVLGRVDLNKNQNKDPVALGMYKINLPIVESGSVGNQGIRSVYMPIVSSNR